MSEFLRVLPKRAPDMLSEAVLAASAAAGLYVFDWDPVRDRIQWLHAPGAVLGGYPLASLCSSRDLQRLTHHEDVCALQQGADIPATAELRLREQAAGWIWIEFRGSRTADGRIVGTLRDITAQKRIESQMAISALMLETVHDAVLLTDSSGLVSWANAAAAGFFGVPLGHLPGRMLTDFVADSRERRLEQLQEIRDAMARAGIWRGRCNHRSATGEAIPADAVVTRVQGDDGEIWLHVRRDLRDQVQLQQAAQDSTRTEQLRLGTLLHESLGQDLVAASMLLAALRVQLPEETAQQVSEIDGLVRHAADRCRLLAQDLPSYVLGREGLATALQQLARWLLREHQATLTIAMGAAVEDLSEEAGATVHRVVRDAVLGIAPWVAAGALDLRLWSADDRFLVTLTVAQDRSGIDWNALASRLAGADVEVLGGSIDTVPLAPRGRRLILQIPLASANAPVLRPAWGT